MTEAIQPSAGGNQALRAAIRAHHRTDEAALVRELARRARFSPVDQRAIFEQAKALVQKVRADRSRSTGIDAFLATYDLSSREGIVILCMAEALLRIPDAGTVDRLIRDKMAHVDWAERLGGSHSVFVNASTWALMLTGRLISLGDEDRQPTGTFGKLLARVGEPVIRQAMIAAMHILGRQFVLGRGIEEALERAQAQEQRGYRHSYDMLGEAARTSDDALRYFESYSRAIAAIGGAARDLPVLSAPSISVKLSALHPRYEAGQHARVMKELLPAAKKLALLAKRHNIGLSIDAEEADRLEISLDVVEALALDPELAGWNGLGFAVQAYQTRALPTLDWLADLAHRARRRLIVRLVKGAYWDAEVKLAQERGLSAYPVFTRKQSTDVSYLACARRLFADRTAFYPAFATHNAHTLAAVARIALAADAGTDWEYQRLHGMGWELYDQVVGDERGGIACRVYAPVGSHEALLAYLVRRLLENGANTSFVNHIADVDLPVETLLADPADKVLSFDTPAAGIPHPCIPLPDDLYRAAGDDRPNSKGRDMFDQATLADLRSAIEISRDVSHKAAPIIAGDVLAGAARPICSPAKTGDIVGRCVDATLADCERAMDSAARAFPRWGRTPASTRAAALESAGRLLQERLPELVALIVREGGRTQGDAVAEVREAVDFCHYYAKEARLRFAAPIELPGPTGETNILSLHGRGVFVCISPSNLPLAVFVGQIAAALAAGNTVAAKPAGQTPLVAAAAVALLHEAGVPAEALHFLPGDAAVGAALVWHPACAGVAFTGSTETARGIARALAAQDGPIVPLIAESGGQNALIADSSAQPEQLVRDVVASAFNSAGQRASALRVLCVQADIADRVIEMLKGAMGELVIGDPADIRSDVGPVIDAAARDRLEAHCRKLDGAARLIHRCPLPESLAKQGTWFAPAAYEIDDFELLKGEVSGPVLQVVRWQSERLGELCNAIAATGYGLTLGIHSRIDETIAFIGERLPVGNTYVNRNMIGAVVGVQPFGGEGLSGTGPKSGGPHYLPRFANERAITVDTTAAGGNASLMSMDEGS